MAEKLVDTVVAVAVAVADAVAGCHVHRRDGGTDNASGGRHHGLRGRARHVGGVVVDRGSYAARANDAVHLSITSRVRA